MTIVEILNMIEKEVQKAKERWDESKERAEIDKNIYHRLRESQRVLFMAYPEFVDSQRLYDGSYDEISSIEGASKLLSIEGELTTSDIYRLLKEKGKTWNSKNPLGSLTAALHNAAKNKKYGIVRIGRSRWALD